MRCFVAVPLPPAIGERVAAVQAQLRGACAGLDVRWSAAGSWHLTLKFLGTIEVERLGAIGDGLAACLSGARLPALSLAGLGAFPGPRRARVVWIGVGSGAAELADLAGAIDRALVPLGFPPGSDPFAAHVTLGRVRRPPRGADLSGALAACGEVDAGSWTPESVVLYESHLRPGGAVHDARAAWPLR